MTIGWEGLLLYTGAMAILFLTPGPVWVALVARALAGGFHAAWPLALGVVVGDVIWPLLAIYGVALLVEIYADFLILLKYGGAIVLIVMGCKIILRANKPIVADERLNAAGMWAGFLAGLMVIIGNPKAIIFYMGMLPNFFDISRVNGWDIAVICSISAIVPFIGNVFFAMFVAKLKKLLSSQAAIRRTNQISGGALGVVGLIIAST